MVTGPLYLILSFEEFESEIQGGVERRGNMHRDKAIHRRCKAEEVKGRESRGCGEVLSYKCQRTNIDRSPSCNNGGAMH